MTETAKHPYHLVNPSPWPAVGALSALCLTYGLVLLLHQGGPVLFVIGVALMIFTMAGWWRDVIREASQGDHTPVVQIGLRYGMALFIASEVMFFVAWFWAYFDASLYPGGANSLEMITRTQVLGGTWPPVSLQGKVFDPWGVPFLNTIILLTSGVTVTWAHHALRENNRQQLLLGLLVTIVLGATFTSLQAHEYANSQFGFTDGIYASTFFMATGFHGAHVIIGTIFLTVCLVRAYLGHFKPDHHFGFEAAAWYWHFVDVVWLFLFTFVYWRPFFS
ncbi:MAG: cytochrome c oxidase subunit 3 [Alphaproteobacteria bacterium]